jgi:hypothetical protein
MNTKRSKIPASCALISFLPNSATSLGNLGRCRVDTIEEEQRTLKRVYPFPPAPTCRLFLLSHPHAARIHHRVECARLRHETMLGLCLGAESGAGRVRFLQARALGRG